MDDDAVEGARAVFKDLFKVDAECRDISGVVGRITQYLDLLEQATAVGQHRKREILVDLHLGPNEPGLMGLADADDKGALRGRANLPWLPARLAEYL